METGLTLSGWFLLVSAWGLVIAGTLFCFWRVLVGKQKNNRHVPAGRDKTDKQ